MADPPWDMPDSQSTADPDRPCPHGDYVVDAVVQSVSEAEDMLADGLIVDIRAWCTECDQPVIWRPSRLTPQKPMLSPDGRLLRIPGHMADRAPELGLWTPQGEV